MRLLIGLLPGLLIAGCHPALPAEGNSVDINAAASAAQNDIDRYARSGGRAHPARKPGR